MKFHTRATFLYVTRVAYCVMASVRKGSPIWEYFILAEDSCLAICQLCKDEVLHGVQSTKSYMTINLVHHLKMKHGQEYVEYENKKSEKQPGLLKLVRRTKLDLYDKFP